jgi:hypothetical protein
MDLAKSATLPKNIPAHAGSVKIITLDAQQFTLDIFTACHVLITKIDLVLISNEAFFAGCPSSCSATVQLTKQAKTIDR